MTMQQLRVGKKYPGAYRQQDCMTPVVDGPAISFIVTLGGVTAKEAAAVQRAPLRLNWGAEHAIPFIAVGFPGCATFDCYINIHKEPQANRDAFLGGEPEANLLTWYLVDWRSGILKAIRVYGADPALLPGVKEACFAQLGQYPDAAAVDAAANRILAVTTTDDILNGRFA